MAVVVPWRMLADSEYFYEKEAEYFGFTPFQLLDEIGEIVVKAVFGMFDNVADNLTKITSFLNKGQIEAGVGQWSALVETRFGRNYELFESYVIKNVLVIPDTFVLPHHRGAVVVPFGPEEEAVIDEKITALLERLQRARTQDSILDHEDIGLQQEEELVAKMETQLDTLKTELISHHFESFERMTQELSDQLASLKSIVVETIEQSKDLQLAEAGDYQEERWLLERHLHKSVSINHIEQLEREFVHCQQIVTMEDLNVLQLLL